jgi:hypothetical protein
MKHRRGSIQEVEKKPRQIICDPAWGIEKKGF